MNPPVRNLLLAFTLVSLPAIAAAQGGCVNSPENPTAVLALIGGVAAACSVVRSRLKG